MVIGNIQHFSIGDTGLMFSDRRVAVIKHGLYSLSSVFRITKEMTYHKINKKVG